jgi:hypothetical protein
MKGQLSPQMVKQLKDYIILAACSANEILPTNPELPADLFTSCLTTPIKIALRWFTYLQPYQSSHKNKHTNKESYIKRSIE